MPMSMPIAIHIYITLFHFLYLYSVRNTVVNTRHLWVINIFTHTTTVVVLASLHYCTICQGKLDLFVCVSGRSDLCRLPTQLIIPINSNLCVCAFVYLINRAATIEAETAGHLWAMDRQTFRRILLKSAFRKRKMYESLLDSVPMLKTLQVC